MSGFATIDDPGPVRVVLVGAGRMGRNWLTVISASDEVELVGIADLDVGLARQAASTVSTAIQVGTDGTEVAEASGAQALINVTVPQAHQAVNRRSLFAGRPVLCEKPIASTVAEALALVAVEEASGQLLMTSQSRRYYAALRRYRQAIDALGGAEILTTEFFKAPHFGGFREEMDNPLLVDMAIHPFDVARFLLDADPISVYCEAFNPSWSWFRGAAAATATFEFPGNVRYAYTGSWVSPGLETAWNGRWRASGPRGSAMWDGDADVRVGFDGGPEGVAAPVDGSGHEPEEIAGALHEFVQALRSGAVPPGDVHRNTLSLAMVEGAVRSADTGRRVRMDSVLTDGHEEAIARESDPTVKAILEGWDSPGSALGLVPAQKSPARGSLNQASGRSM